MKIRLELTGTVPLLMHNPQLASPLNPYAKKLKELSSKRVKTDDDRLEMAKIEFNGGLYFDEELGPYVPGTWIFGSLIKAAKAIKAGEKVKGAVVVTSEKSPLIYTGPRTREGLWGKGVGESPFVDLRSAGVQTNRVDRCRPIFHVWGVEFEALLDTRLLDFAEFAQIAEDAGSRVGIGDYRLLYGRYDVKLEQL